jgi:hypothetical protein
MRVAVVDQGFVPASPERAFEMLRLPDAYPGWWPGVRAGRGGIDLPVLGEVSVSVERVRTGVGLLVGVTGRRASGHLEWYLEPFEEGTLVSCITDLEVRRAWSPRRVRRWRASVRSGLVALEAMAR